jgi:hypothetical protein
MSLRKIAEFRDTKTNAVAKVYRDAEWNEYRVKFYNSAGTYMDASDYHTNDKEDAMNTAGINHPDIVRVL